MFHISIGDLCLFLFVLFLLPLNGFSQASPSAQLDCELIVGKSLDQGSTNYRPQANSSWSPTFINTVLLEFRHIHSFGIVYAALVL